MVHKTPSCGRRAMWIAAILVSVARAASAQDDLVLERALHYFTRHDAGEIFEVQGSRFHIPLSTSRRRLIAAICWEIWPTTYLSATPAKIS